MGIPQRRHCSLWGCFSPCFILPGTSVVPWVFSVPLSAASSLFLLSQGLLLELPLLHLIFPADRRSSSCYTIQSVKSEPEAPALCACVSSNIPDNFQGAEIREKTVLGDCWRGTSITPNLLTLQLESGLNHYYKLA